MKQKLRFLHIPKTAGTTLTKLIELQYSQYNKFNFSGDIVGDLKRFDALSRSEQCSVNLFTGHAPFEIDNDIVRSSKIITFLRNPISRVKSFCQHVSEGKSPYLLEKYPPDSFDLDRFLESGNGELENLQTKMLSCNLCSDSNNKLEMLNSAEYNLFNNIYFFGIQEYFDVSVILLHKRMNWKMPLYKNHNRKNEKKLIEFQEHHLEYIESLNKLDVMLYEKAKSFFRKSLEVLPAPNVSATNKGVNLFFLYLEKIINIKKGYYL